MIAGAAFVIAISCAILPPLAQDPLYHAFADGRTLHAGKLSLLPLILLGLAATLYSVARRRPLEATAATPGRLRFPAALLRQGADQ